MKRTMLVLFSGMALFSCKKNESTDTAKTASLPVISNTSSFAGSAYTTFFRDDFNSGTAPSTSTWIMKSGSDPNSSICTYNTSVPKIGVVDGISAAIITATKTGTNTYQSGRFESQAIFTPANNEELKFEAKIKLIARSGGVFKGFAETNGAWPAFWMVNHTAWPTNGEVDFMEAYSHAGHANPSTRFTSNVVYGTSAGSALVGPGDEVTYPAGFTTPEGWHTYTCYWKKQNNISTIKFVVDGITITTVTNSSHTNLNLNNFNNLQLVFNLAIGDTHYSAEFQNNTNLEIFDQTEMWIDYVSVGRLSL